MKGSQLFGGMIVLVTKFNAQDFGMIIAKLELFVFWHYYYYKGYSLFWDCIYLFFVGVRAYSINVYMFVVGSIDNLEKGHSWLKGGFCSMSESTIIYKGHKFDDVRWYL